MSVCTTCLRSTHLVDHNGRLWCSWCSGYADRYARRMPGTLDVACSVRFESPLVHPHCLVLNCDIRGAWCWPGAVVELCNRSDEPLVLSYSLAPDTCLELVVRRLGGDRLSRRSRPEPGLCPAPAREPLHTGIPPGQRLAMAIDPLAEVTDDAIRAGEYTAQAVFRHGDWQAVSEPTPFWVTAVW
jgi:hypothetical protein